jgi:hypothetical protein
LPALPALPALPVLGDYQRLSVLLLSVTCSDLLVVTCSDLSGSVVGRRV